MAGELLDIENPIFRAWIFYNAILVVKMLAMSILTAKQRFRKKVFANPEDVRGSKHAKVRFDDDDVERVRRAHLNDLENILVYFLASYIYMYTNPTAFVAVNLFRAFTIARVAHTLVYAVFPVPQPARGISWGVGYFITAYMGISTIINFL